MRAIVGQAWCAAVHGVEKSWAQWATELNWCWSWSSNTLAISCKESTLEKTLMLGKIEGKRGMKQERTRWLDSITDSTDMNFSKFLEIVKNSTGVLQFMGSQRVRHRLCNNLKRSKINHKLAEDSWASCFHPWVWKIPWRRAWQPTSVFLPGESPWIEEPGRLQSMVSQRDGHDWATKHSTA